MADADMFTSTSVHHVAASTLRRGRVRAFTDHAGCPPWLWVGADLRAADLRDAVFTHALLADARRGPAGRLGRAWRPATTSPSASARGPQPARATCTCAPPWPKRPGPPGAPPPAPGARFRRLARRFGKGNEKKAAVAVARTLLCIAWAVMRYDGDYADAGTGYYEQRDQRNREHLVRYHQHALARLGYQVTLAASTTTAHRQARAPRPVQPRARPPDP